MAPKLVSSAFLAVVFGVPLAQASWELSRGEPVQALEVVGPIERARLDAFEDDLRDASFLHELASPVYQWALVELFGHGNEKAVVGRDGWIYYGQDLDLVTAPGFLEDGSSVALETICDFRDQLEHRGVELLLLPVPAKSEVDPEHLSPWTAHLESARNTDTAEFFEELNARGVHVVELDDLYQRLGEDLYLARDTHWSPKTMAEVASLVASRVRSLLGEDVQSVDSAPRWRLRAQSVEGAGDLTGMLRLPARSQSFDSMQLTTERVVDAASGADFEADPAAGFLLLGDSFSGVFDDAGLGLGEGAGFAGRLAFELNASVDAITIPGGSSKTVRERLARRPLGVTGKELVIWQISQRDLIADANAWARVELPEVQESAETDPLDAPPATGDALNVVAEVVGTSRIPEDFDYAFCLGIVEYRLIEQTAGAELDSPFHVAHVIMVDFESTADAEMEIGERHRLTLDPVEKHHDLDATSWIDDTGAGMEIWFPTAFERLP